MPINVRVIPEWTDFASRLVKAIQQREHESDRLNQNDQEDTLFINVHPSVQFNYSCAPLHHLHCITSYSGCSGNVVLGFKWGQTEFKHQIDTWVDDGQGNLRHHSTVPVDGRYKIELMLFIPSRGVLVGYCNDMCLRILTDKTQEMVVLCQTECPASVVSMHYCPETNELLTGSMGLIAFWGFFLSAQAPLSLLRILDWTSCSIQRDTIISGFVSQRQTNSIYILCNRNIKSLEYMGEKKLFDFRGQSFSTLRCAVSEWRQRYLYTGDAEGYVQVWSYDTRCLFLQFRAHADAVTSVVLQPESGSILTASTGCWIKQWTRTGDLLLKLHTDMGGVRSMWKLGKNVILCQSSNSLDVWSLNSVYRSFNDTACSVRVLQRLDCGRRKARILAVTRDGIIRFFSPVTGELLFLSWPFLHIDKALSFAYDPLQEELYICDGSVEVLVLNTTLSPCPVKHVINTVKDGNDGVLCLATVLLWSFQDGAGNDSALCLVFSGHSNGRLQLLAPHGLFCKPKQAHIGAISQMTSSNAGKTPLICCYGTDSQFTLWSISFGENQVDLIRHHQINCNFNPAHCRLLKGFVCAVSPQQNLILYSLHGEKATVIERKRSETISCLDYCPQLDIIAVSSQSGKVEIWNPSGDLVAEIQLGVPVTQVCFGNNRGDILASFSDSISIMSVIHVLPPSYLRTVLRQAPSDEVIERPVPFLPKSPSRYDISLVATIYVKYIEMESEAAETFLHPIKRVSMPEEDIPSAGVPDRSIRKSIVRPFPFRKRRQAVHTISPPTVSEQEPAEMDEVSEEAVVEGKSFEEDFLSFLSHIAPDGYIPNSVVRAIHIMEQEEEEEERRKRYERELEEEDGGGLPVGLLRDYDDMEEGSHRSKHSEAINNILTRTKELRRMNTQQQVMKVDGTAHIQELGNETVQDTDEVPEEMSEGLMQRISRMVEDLDTTSEDDYKGTSANLLALLRQIRDKSVLEKSVMDSLKEKLVSHVVDYSLTWRQYESLNSLRRLCFLHRSDIGVVASMLIHPYPELRSLALSILGTDYNIFDKQALRKRLQGIMSPKDLEALLAKLTDDLQLFEADTYVATPSITDTHLSETTDTELDKPSTTSVSQKSEDAKVHYRKSRKSKKSSDNVIEDLLGKQEEHTEEKKKHTQMLTKELRSSRMVYFDTPKSHKSKTEHASRRQSNWGNIADVVQSRFSPDNPLLYAFRKSRTCGSNMLSPMESAMPKYESRLLPIDSGFMSLVNQEVSTKRPPASQGGSLMPIGKPKKVISKAKLTSQCTSQLLYPSPQNSQHHFDPIHQDVISQPHNDIALQRIHNIDHHYDMTPEHPHTDHHYDDEFLQHSNDTTHHYDITSQQPHDTHHHYDVNSQHCHDDAKHYDTTHHYDITSQRPRHTHHYDITSQHPRDTKHRYVSFQPTPDVHDDQKDYATTTQDHYNIEHHYDIPSQEIHSRGRARHYGINTQHSNDTSQHFDITSPDPYNDAARSVPLSADRSYLPDSTEHPQSLSHPPRHISQNPQSTSQHDLKPLPRHASQAKDQAFEQGEVREQGDANWRESLHKLISLYGFRSRKAAKAAAGSVCVLPQQPRLRAKTILPALRYRPPWPGAPGERVLQKVELSEGGGSCTSAPLKFQHEIPLPWRLSHFPLKPQGQVRYGKLEMDWVRSETGLLTLPKIDPKRSLIQL